MVGGVDALIVLIAVMSRSQAYLAAGTAIAGSLAGSLILFLIARKGGEEYHRRHTSSARGAKFRAWFHEYGLVTVFVPAFVLAVVFLYLYSGPFTAVAQNVVSPGLRASAVTMLLFISHVFGDSHSTFDVGWISDRIGSLQTALLITSPTLLILAAIVAATGLRTVRGDVQTMERDWAARSAVPTVSY